MVKPILIVALMGLLSQAAAAQGKVSFPPSIDSKVDSRSVKLRRTGAAVRKVSGVEIYAVASYVEESAKPRDAQELAAANHVKQLELIFFRSVAGDEMARSFLSIFRRNYPEPAFSDEAKLLMQFMEKMNAKQGHHIWITHIPKVGLRCRRDGQEELLIRTPSFSRAVWDNYLGEYNAGEAVKKGLVSELGS